MMTRKRFCEICDSYGIECSYIAMYSSAYNRGYRYYLDDAAIVTYYDSYGSIYENKCNGIYPSKFRYGSHGLYTVSENGPEIETEEELVKHMDECFDTYKKLKKEYTIEKIKDM